MACFPNRRAALLFLAAAVVIVTPLCGFLFQCGCDWPWAGLAADCNYYRPGAEHHCPWCVSGLAAALSTGPAAGAGVWVSGAMNTGTAVRPGWLEVPFRAALGTAVFLPATVPGAALSAWFQGYPLGIGKFFVAGVQAAGLS